MQQKTNVDQLLADSFKELVLKTSIDKITIKEITDKAGVIRPTFYNHFQDKYELLEWIIKTEVLDPIKPLIQGGFFREGLILIFSNALKSKEFCLKAAKLEGQNSFESIIKNCIKKILIDYFQEIIGTKSLPHPWMTSELLAEYYAQSMTFVVMMWIKKDMVISPEEMAKIYEYIINRSMDDIIKEIK